MSHSLRSSAKTATHPPRATRLAWTCWAVTIGVLVASGWYALHQGGPIALSTTSLQDVIYIAAVIVVPSVTTGALIVSRQPWNAVGWVFLAAGALQATGQLAEAYANASRSGSHTVAAVLAGANEIIWMVPPLLLITLVPLLFPNGHTPGRRWNWLFGIIAIAVGCLVASSLWEGWSQHETIAAGVETLANPSGPVRNLLLCALAATSIAIAGSFSALIVRYRQGSVQERDQLEWFFFGLLITVATIVLELTVVPDSIARTAWFATLALPASIAIGVLRYQLFDIDVVFSRTILWGLLTAFVIGTYVLIVGLIGSRLAESRDLLLSLIATGIVAICFQPLRVRLQSAINRRIFGDRDDPYTAVARLGRQLERVANPQVMLSAVAESVAQGLKLPYTAISLRDGHHFAIAASYGTIKPGSGTVTFPLISSSEQVGELILAPRTPNERFGPADMRLLADLARQIGVAAHAVQLTTDLQRSREQLVIAREEERRRIRNDLHDGLGPVLSGLKLRAETARNLVSDNPQVDALLADIAERTETAVADVRRLVYSLRPPALDDLGLGAALEELGYQAGVPVTVTLPNPMPSLSAAIEVAVFRITQEALTNVARHANATTAHIELRADASQLAISISDDGRGLPAEARSGVGLRSMRERVSELGGTLVIDSSDGAGTTIQVTFPPSLPIVSEADDVH